MDSVTLIWGVIFGSIGFAYFIYGKKQSRFVPLVSGLGLMFFPYLVSNTIVLVIIGLLLSAIPYFVRF